MLYLEVLAQIIELHVSKALANSCLVFFAESALLSAYYGVLSILIKRHACDRAGTADLGHQLQLCGHSYQHAHGSPGLALQPALAQASQAQVQQGGEVKPQKGGQSYQRTGAPLHPQNCAHSTLWVCLLCLLLL